MKIIVMLLLGLSKYFSRTISIQAVRTSSEAVTKKITLLTFDVDGTLVHGSSKKAEVSSHAKSFSYALARAFGFEGDFEIKVPTPLLKVPAEKYHGSTDGLISLNFAKYALNISPDIAYKKLPLIFDFMYEYVSKISDEEFINGIEPLPGVIPTLMKISSDPRFSSHCRVGLVTGNVEGIARKKMRACGILSTNILSPKASDQNWKGEDSSSFLGGFGSDFCSGDISDISRMYKDRGEQIAIAVRRVKSTLKHNEELVRVVHIGDAPSDVKAAKWCAEQNLLGNGITVGCIAVATGKFSAELLNDLIGDPVPNIWEPIVLEKGLADPLFIESCKISYPH